MEVATEVVEQTRRGAWTGWFIPSQYDYLFRLNGTYDVRLLSTALDDTRAKDHAYQAVADSEGIIVGTMTLETVCVCVSVCVWGGVFTSNLMVNFFVSYHQLSIECVRLCGC